jgi:hypothetical protein
MYCCIASGVTRTGNSDPLRLVDGDGVSQQVVRTSARADALRLRQDGDMKIA